MKKILLILSFCIAALSAGAQSVSSLLIPVEMSPETAALSGVKHVGWVQYGMWAPKTADNTFLGAGAYSSLGGKLALGLDFKYFKDPAYEITNASGIASGEFAPNDKIAGLGVFYTLSENLSMGLTGRFVSSAIGPDAKGSAICGDLSLAWQKDALGINAGIYNLGTKISYGKSASYALPAYARVGGSYKVADLTVKAAADYLLAGAFGALVGVEYTVIDIVTAKAGYHYGSSELGLPSYAVLGFAASYSGIGLSLSYLLASDTIGGSLLAGLSYSF